MIGIVSGWVYVGASKLLLKLRIDDAVDAVPVHMFCGIWGCIATGIFADPERVAFAYGIDDAGGIFYGYGNVLGTEIVGVLCIILWCAGVMTPFFFGLNMLGMFRVDPVEEKVGLDISHHKGAAYDLTGPNQDDVNAFAQSKHGGEKFNEDA